MMRPIIAACLIGLTAFRSVQASTGPASVASQRAPAGMVVIPAGAYQSLYATASGRRVRVSAFALDRAPVTRDEFLEFVRSHPTWRRTSIPRLFADRSYLSGWRNDLDAGDSVAARDPVTSVSWFAAKAFCAAAGKRLPTTDEWEYVAAASETKRDATNDPRFLALLLARYAAHSRPPGFVDVYGVEFHGQVWEWTLDFNSVVVPDDSRATGGGVDARDHSLFCAAAAIGATELGNYSAFLRAAMRAGLTGRMTLDGLGFRCAADISV